MEYWSSLNPESQCLLTWVQKYRNTFTGWVAYWCVAPNLCVRASSVCVWFWSEHVQTFIRDQRNAGVPHLEFCLSVQVVTACAG